MSKKVPCRCKSEEHSHLCMLRSNGRYDEIAVTTSDPKFYCFTCGGEANCSENLCDPVPIE